MADIGHTMTLTFATSSFSTQPTSIDISQSRTVVDTTHMGSAGISKTAISGLHDPGSFSFDYILDPNDEAPIKDAAEVITITFPTPSGGSTGATLVGTGFISDWSLSMPDDDKMTASATVTWVSDPTWSDST